MRKMLFIGVISLILLSGFVLLGCGSGAESEAKAGPQTACPVMGRAIDKNIYVDYGGKRIYFCCEDCPKAFEKDPAKFMKKIADAGVVLEDAP